MVRPRNPRAGPGRSVRAPGGHPAAQGDAGHRGTEADGQRRRQIGGGRRQVVPLGQDGRLDGQGRVGGPAPEEPGGDEGPNVPGVVETAQDDREQQPEQEGTGRVDGEGSRREATQRGRPGDAHLVAGDGAQRATGAHGHQHAEPDVMADVGAPVAGVGAGGCPGPAPGPGLAPRSGAASGHAPSLLVDQEPSAKPGGPRTGFPSPADPSPGRSASGANVAPARPGPRRLRPDAAQAGPMPC